VNGLANGPIRMINLLMKLDANKMASRQRQ
jgi:hypothetical protein